MLRNVLFSLAVCCLFGACSTKQDMDTRPVDGVIRLGAGGIVTRSVDDMAGLAAVGNKIGIIGVPTSGNQFVLGNAQWGAPLVMDNVCTTAVDAATGAMSWAGVYYYPLEKDSYIQFCAYYPFAATGTSGANYLAAPAAGQAPVLHFTLTGSEDLMFAKPVVGSSSAAPGKLSFEHALTQLQFALVDEYGAYADATLESITVLGVNASGAMNVETGELGEWGGSTDLALSGFSPVAIARSSSAAPQLLDGELMLQPGAKSFTLRVVTSRATFDNVVVRPTSTLNGVKETAFAAGRSYRVTLTFKQRLEIESGATVVPWVLGGTGEGVVQ